MVNAELSLEIAVSADRLWDFLIGEELGELITGVYADKIDFEETEDGVLVTTTLREGKGQVRERIDEIDNETKCFKYRVLDPGPWPYANYRGEMRVIGEGENASRLRFQSRFDSVGVSEEESKEHWLEHNTEVMNAVKEMLVKQ